MPRWRNWYTRTTQNRVSQGVRVRPPPEAQHKKAPFGAFLCCASEYMTKCHVREGVEEVARYFVKKYLATCTEVVSFASPTIQLDAPSFSYIVANRIVTAVRCQTKE